MNPFFNAMGGQHGNPMMQQFQNFMQQMKGKDPNAMIQEMVSSGRISQAQLDQVQKQAQQMQDKMQKMQEEIAQLEVTGESGAGLVKVTINGAHNCRRVEIDPSLLEDDKEMLEDLVAAAFNDAARRIEETQKEKMASVSAGMQLPPGFKMPF